MNWREELIQETIAEWQGDYKETLTDQDAAEILSNVTAYFRTLEKWAYKLEALKQSDGRTSVPKTPAGGTPQ